MSPPAGSILPLGVIATASLVLCLLQAGSAAAADEPSLSISGVQVLPLELVQQAAGPPPADPTVRAGWAVGAQRRILQLYHSRSYSYARAWHKVDADGKVQIDVDEGRMRISFRGAGNIRAFFYRLDLNLPHGVYHFPTLKRALEELKKKHNLANVYYRVRLPGEYEINDFGEPVPLRVLKIFIVSPERVGLGFNISLSSTWGILPGVAYDQRGLIWPDDLLKTRLQLAFPFRRYFFDDEPQFRWVHGGVEGSYRLPRLLGRRIAPRLGTSLYLSRYVRSDLAIESYQRLRSTTLASLVLYYKWLEVALGGGVDLVRVFEIQRTDQQSSEPDDGLSSVRGLGRLSLELEPSGGYLRRDLRQALKLRFDIASSADQRWLINSRLSGQSVFVWGRHQLHLRGRALVLRGDVRFWDEVQLAGSYQRVFFSGRYWVHEALQLELAYRFCLRDWLVLGLFHDGSLFWDRSGAAPAAALANAFGPGLHFLLWDLFAVDLYYGFGFAPVGFSHNLSFNMQTVF